LNSRLINFFNYSPQPAIKTTAGIVKPQGNYYYKVGDNLTGTVTIDLTLNGTTEAIAQATRIFPTSIRPLKVVE
jgi:hypothetical protein